MSQRQSLRNIHYALLTSDTAIGVEYATPKPLVGAISAKISPTANQEKLWADDGVFDIANNLGDISVELELATLPLQAQATLLGHTYLDGVMTMKASDEPPYLAIGFMSQPSPGRFRFVWLYKGKFGLVQDEYATATDAASWRNAKLTGTFVRRDFDGEWQVIADSGDAGFTGADFWFKSVYPNTPPAEPEPEE